jgi:hypothetical protein
MAYAAQIYPMASMRSLQSGWALMAELALPSAELIAEAQINGAGTTHRDGFVKLRVVCVQFGPRVGKVLAVDLHEPRVLSETERPIISCEGRQVLSNGVALLVKRKVIGRSEGV